MKIEYTLTIGQLIRANSLLNYYRVKYPILIFTLIFSAYCYYINSYIPLFIGIPGGIIIGAITSLTIGGFNIKKNRHFAGNRNLDLSDDGYKYHGEQFSREAKWSPTKKAWYTPWYVFLDVASMFPVIVDRNVLSENQLNEIKRIMTN